MPLPILLYTFPIGVIKMTSRVTGHLLSLYLVKCPCKEEKINKVKRLIELVVDTEENMATTNDKMIRRRRKQQCTGAGGERSRWATEKPGNRYSVL